MCFITRFNYDLDIKEYPDQPFWAADIACYFPLPNDRGSENRGSVITQLFVLTQIPLQYHLRKDLIHR